MKHLLFAVAVLAVGYVLWHIADPTERREGVRFLTRHGLRLGALLLLLLVIVALAYHLPSTNIL